MDCCDTCDADVCDSHWSESGSSQVPSLKQKQKNNKLIILEQKCWVFFSFNSIPLCSVQWLQCIWLNDSTKFDSKINSIGYHQFS